MTLGEKIANISYICKILCEQESLTVFLCCISLIFQDILDEMRKELTKLKEELIDGECLNKFATLIMFNNTHFKENED